MQADFLSTPTVTNSQDARMPDTLSDVGVNLVRL